MIETDGQKTDGHRLIDAQGGWGITTIDSGSGSIENTIEIAKRCNLHFELFQKNYLPVFPTPEGMSIAEFFSEESKKGLEIRLEGLKVDRKTYDERLSFELSVILEMDFPGYFLIVSDFIRWAKENGIPVGPGRGSGAGSLVAWSLTITNLDPIKFGLLFERFLNPIPLSTVTSFT